MADSILEPDPAAAPTPDPTAEPQGQGQAAPATVPAAPAPTPKTSFELLNELQEPIVQNRAPADRTPAKPWVSLADFAPWTMAARVGEGTVQDVLALEDLFKSGPPKERDKIFGEPESIVGGFVQGGLEFLTFFIPSSFAVKVAGKGLGLTAKLGRAASFAEAISAGAVADFMMSTHGAALSGFLRTLPSDTARDVGNVLASDDSDTQLERRLKGMLEGIFVGSLLDGVVAGLKSARHAMRGDVEGAEAAAKGIPGDAAKVDGEAANRSVPPEGPTFTPGATPGAAPGAVPGAEGAAAAGGARRKPIAEFTPYDTLRNLIGEDGITGLPKDVAETLSKLGEIDPKNKEKYFDQVLQALANPKKGDNSRVQWKTPTDVHRAQALFERLADDFAPNDMTIPMVEQTRTDIKVMGDILGDTTVDRIANQIGDEGLRVVADEGLRKTNLAGTLARIHAYVRVLRAFTEGHAGVALDLARTSVADPGNLHKFGDALDGMMFQLGLSAEARAASSEMGRGLGSVRIKSPVEDAAIGKLKEKWLKGEPISPLEAFAVRASENPVAPFGALADDPEAFAQALERFGGEKGAREALNHLVEVAKADFDPTKVAKIVNDNADMAIKTPKTLEFALELYINDILSGLRSMVNVATQQTTQGIYWQPIRNYAGAKIQQGISAVLGNKQRAADYAQAAAGALGTLKHALNVDSMNGLSSVIRMAYKTGQSGIMEHPEATFGKAFKGGPKIAYEPIREWFKNGPLKGMVDPDGVYARTMYYMMTEKGIDLGKWIRMPGSVYAAEDAATKYVAVKSILHGEFEARAAREFPGDAKAAAAYVQQSMDQAFRNNRLATLENVRAEASGRARQEGILNGWTPSQVDKRTKELVEEIRGDDSFINQTIDWAARQANEASSTLRPTPGSAANAIIRYSNDHVWPRFFLPFMSSTWSNISTGLRAFNPVGWAETLMNLPIPADKRNLTNLRSSLAREFYSSDVRDVASATGRMATAAMISGSIAYWASQKTPDGLPTITGAGPKNPDARKLLQEAGWKPYSLRVGDQYVSYARMDPIAFSVGLIADIVDFGNYAADREIPGFQRATGSVIHAITEQIKSKSYMQGMADLLDTVMGNQPWQTTAKKLAGGFIPNAFTQSGVAGPAAWLGAGFGGLRIGAAAGFLGAAGEAMALPTDPYIRESRDLVDELERRLPFASSNVAPRRNVLGEPIEKTKYVGLDAFSPWAYSQVSDDLVDKEFARVGAAFRTPDRIQQGVDLTTIPYGNDGATMYDRWQELIGATQIGGRDLRKQLRRVIQSPWYQKIVPEPGIDNPQIEILRGVIEDYRAMAFGKVMRESQPMREQVFTRERAKAAAFQGKVVVPK